MEAVDQAKANGGNSNKFTGEKTLNSKWSEDDIKGLTRFSENLEALLQSEQLSDFTIQVKNTEVRIHRPILAARSTVFASLLEVDGTSKSLGDLTIADCDLETFRDFLHYLYTGKTERIRIDNVIGLFEMASKYAVPLLKEECESFLKDSICVDTVCDVLSAGLRLDEAGLILMGTQCFLSNSREILPTLKWQKFLEVNTDAANELIIGSLNIPPGNETANAVNGTNQTSFKNTNYKHLMNLSESIQTMFLNDHFSDFTVKVSDREFRVHKAIVASQSAVFASMLQHEMKESITGISEVSDCDPDVFEDFLFYLYSGKTQRISETNAVCLYRVADVYNVCKLKEECGRFMRDNISVECFCDVIALAMVHNDTDLIEVATKYFVSNAREIISSEKWRLFSKKNTTVANELYIKRADFVGNVS